MITRVSFGSTYKFNQSLYSSNYQKRSLDEVLDHAIKNGYEYNEDLFKTDKTERTATIVVPDEFDADIETICNNLGVPFRKMPNETSKK